MVEIDDDTDISTVSWNAPNCTVSYLGIINSKRRYSITPNNSISNGSQIQISANAAFVGGCSATSISKDFFVYQGATPTTPAGSIYMTPIGSSNPCLAEGYEVHFTNPYSNGITTITPAILPPHAGTNPRQFNVCFINRCTGAKVCKNFTGYPPAPCNERMAEYSLFSLFPNPNKGDFSIQFDSNESGIITIYDFYGNKILTQIFKNSENVEIHNDNNLNKGVYIIEVTTEIRTEKQKFIID